jgi:alpha-galactosidase
MRPVSVVIIGAGSTSFAVTSLSSLLREPGLRGSTLVLVDLDRDALQTVHALAERMNTRWDAGVTIESTLDRRAALQGADFVVCAIERVPREGLWRQDWEIPFRHGVRQPRAENGGPGGLAHAARNIPPVLEIARDMERLCPTALLILLSNPLPRLCRAVSKYTSIQVVGLCHQIGFGYLLAGALLMDKTGILLPLEIMEPDPPPYPYGRAFWEAVGKFLLHVGGVIDIKAAGLNHFTWMLDVRDRRTGGDLYPLLRERFLALEDGPEQLTRDMLRLTGHLPVPGDGHLSEYLPFVHNPITKPWERYKLALYDWGRATSGRDELWLEIERLSAGTDGTELDGLRDLPSEGICELVLGVVGDNHGYRPAVNVPNNGAISNLPPYAIVEVPAVVTGMGALPLRMGALPPMIAELCRREVELVELVVDAAVQGNRELALQALCLDPTVDDIDVARAVLNDYLDVHKEHLHQFNGARAHRTMPATAQEGRSNRVFSASEPAHEPEDHNGVRPANQWVDQPVHAQIDHSE